MCHGGTQVPITCDCPHPFPIASDWLLMSPKRALSIVTQVLEWKTRKGFWPVPKNETERKLIHEAFVIIRGMIWVFKNPLAPKKVSQGYSGSSRLRLTPTACDCSNCKQLTQDVPLSWFHACSPWLCGPSWPYALHRPHMWWILAL